MLGRFLALLSNAFGEPDEMHHAGHHAEDRSQYKENWQHSQQPVDPEAEKGGHDHFERNGDCLIAPPPCLCDERSIVVFVIHLRKSPRQRNGVSRR